MGVRACFLWCALTLPCSAATVSQLIVARSVNENVCVAPKAATTFDTADREAFVWFLAHRVRAAEQLQVEWIAPNGAVALLAPYQDVPAAPSLCFASRLPIAASAAASQPGAWTVRVLSGAAVLASRSFRIAGDDGAVRVTAVRQSATPAGIELTIEGAGFGPDPMAAMVHIAQYTPGGGWRYVAAAQPRAATPNRIVADHPPLPAAEYLVIVRNAAGEISRPAPFIVSSDRGYKLPTVAGEPWIVTQGPYGAFSHWGRTLHAYDIAPRSGRCVVAMRAGIAHVHDIGAKQDPSRRTFGNYITIDHGDGEYSHYAHLASGTFVVAEGQRVEQGQALATVGNSGYTLGEGGGYHVHVQVTRSPSISSPSVPFLLDDLKGPLRGQPTVVSSNASAKCDCRARALASTPAPAPAIAGKFTGSIAFAQWWSELVSVPSSAPSFEATLTWPQPDAGLDLHLMSPSGHHYAWYADPTGYAAAPGASQQFRIPHPQPGTWRISVQAVRAGPGPVNFAITTSGTTASPPRRGS